eukprot:tig00020830_g14408.t1
MIRASLPSFICHVPPSDSVPQLKEQVREATESASDRESPEGLFGTGPAPAPAPAPEVEHAYEHERERLRNPLLRCKLYPPGALHFIVLETADREAPMQRVGPEFFDRMLLTRTMVDNHMPDKYTMALGDLLCHPNDLRAPRKSGASRFYEAMVSAL